MRAVCNERHEAIQGKDRHHCVEEPEAGIGTRPVDIPKGEPTRVGSVAASKEGGSCTSAGIPGWGHAGMSA